MKKNEVVPPTESDFDGKTERPKSFLEKFRHEGGGKLNKLGRMGALIVLMNTMPTLEGQSFAMDQEPAKKSGTIEDTMSGPDMEELKELRPNNITIDDHEITLDYSDGSGEGTAETVVDGDMITSDGVAEFEYGGADYGNAELQESERDNIKDQLRTVIDGALADYSEWGIDTDSAVDKVSIGGPVSSSPEGNITQKGQDANQRLSEQRAEIMNEVAQELLQEYGFSEDMVSVDFYGEGVSGDITDLTDRLENDLGFDFEGSDDQVRLETNEFVADYHDGNWDAIFDRLPDDLAESPAQKEALKLKIAEIYDQEIAAERSADVQVSLESKDVKVIAPENQMATTEDTPPKKVVTFLKEYYDPAKRGSNTPGVNPPSGPTGYPPPEPRGPKPPVEGGVPVPVPVPEQPKDPKMPGRGETGPQGIPSDPEIPIEPPQEVSEPQTDPEDPPEDPPIKTTDPPEITKYEKFLRRKMLKKSPKHYVGPKRARKVMSKHIGTKGSGGRGVFG